MRKKFIIALLFSITIVASLRFAVEAKSLNELKEWKGCYPHKAMRGSGNLFQTNTIKKTLLRALGEPLFKKVFNLLDINNKYYCDEPCTVSGDLMRCKFAYYGLDMSFDGILFIDLSKETSDLCFNSEFHRGPWGDQNAVPKNVFYFNTGESKNIDKDQCSKLSNELGAGDNIQYKLRNDSSKINRDDVESKIIGTWEGEFYLKNSNNNDYKDTYTFVIYNEETFSSSLKFILTQSVIFSDPKIVFSCSKTNKLTVKFEGEVEIAKNILKLIEKKSSDPKCSTLSEHVFQFNGKDLDILSLNGVTTTSGSLIRNTTAKTGL